MPHFYITKEEINNNLINLQSNEDLLHHLIKVLRVKKGEKIKLIDEDRIVYNCIIKEVLKKSLSAEIIDCKKSDRVLKNNICLIQSVLAPDAQNLAIANAVQTGVKEIYPVISDNTCVSKNSIKEKREKWQKIADENFKQCERGDLALVLEVCELKRALEQFKKENIIIFAEKHANIDLNRSLTDIDKDDKIAVVIGPEGGFSEAEFDRFKKNSYKLVSLGSMIYKAPNAIVAGVSNIISRIES